MGGAAAGRSHASSSARRRAARSSPVLAEDAGRGGRRAVPRRRRHRRSAVRRRRRGLRAAAAHARRGAATSRAGRSCSTPPASSDPTGLRALYDFFHPLVGKLARSGRVRGARRAPLEDVRTPARGGGADGARRLHPPPGQGDRPQAARPRTSCASTTAPRRAPPAAALSALAARGVRDRRSRSASARQAAPARTDGEVPWARPLEGKVALVTGAARGIGEATARLLAARGRARRLPRSPRRRRAAVADRARDRRHACSSPTSPIPRRRRRSPRELKERLGGVDVVVHNAGITRDKTLGQDEAGAVGPGDRRQPRRGRAHHRRAGGQGRRCATAGASSACRRWRASPATSARPTTRRRRRASSASCARWRRSSPARGITVNAIAPGFIETRLTAAIPVMIREVGRRLSALGQGGLPRRRRRADRRSSRAPARRASPDRSLRVCGGALIGA